MRKKGTVFLLGLAGALVLASGIGRAAAYFTTYTQAGGGVTLSLKSTTSVEETVSKWTKTVKVTNEEGSQPVYVRAKAFCAGEYELEYAGDPADTWGLGEGGYYYYKGNNGILSGGHTTEALKVTIKSIAAAPEDGETFHVAVIYETVPVLYDEKGAEKAPDWTMAAQVKGGAD